MFQVRNACGFPITVEMFLPTDLLRWFPWTNEHGTKLQKTIPVGEERRFEAGGVAFSSFAVKVLFLQVECGHICFRNMDVN